ncbi:hypothetical protein GCM10011581_28550 [Saccharopolyspora subtropica]|uniref:OmpR/PhoB-type domain-containing protein n=1 Tax=Saccharopolyspora thermophila TaxID=89367 RepID=A0A917JY07_9PSEU|nr:winged helix-turn-helix domain-containing protein [Saccharopolyspora subtropica]GGI89705.1 hypothetical protein GCM10011581_28550 [Saccharopolyspora subtropica]
MTLEAAFQEPYLADGTALIEVTARFVVPQRDLAELEREFAQQIRTLARIPRQSDVEVQTVPRLAAVPSPPAEPKLRILVAPRHVLRADGSRVELTRLEFDLLLFLCQNPGRVHRRGALLNAVWHLDSTPSTRTVDVHVRRIRSKLGPDLNLITTVRGVGYRLDGADQVHIEPDPYV